MATKKVKRTASKSTSGKSFSVSDAISYGWKASTRNISFFAVMLLIVIAAGLVPSLIAGLIENSDKTSMIAFVVRLVGWGLQITVSIGIINVTLRLYDKKKSTNSDLFQHFHLVIPYFLASIIYGLIVLVGLILLVIPGIIWSIKFQYFSYFMVDRGMGPIDALKASSELTNGYKWQLFVLKFLIGIINIMGLLCLIVGLFVTAPLGMMAEAYAYRKLSGK